MNSKKHPHSKPSMGNVALVVLVVAIVLITLAHTVSFTQQMITQRVGLPTDWTHQHVIFSNPGTFQEATRNGNFERWYRIVNDPRFQMQQIRRHAAIPIRLGGTTPPRGCAATPLDNPTESRAEEEISEGAIGLLRPEISPGPLKPGPNPPTPPPHPMPPPIPAPGCESSLHKDWSMLPGTGAVGGAGVFPAKYEFYPSTASCSDYVVFPTNVAGSATVPSIVAYSNLYSGCSGNGKVPLVYWSVNLEISSNEATVKTSPVLSFDGTQVAFVASAGSPGVAAYLVVLNMPALPVTSSASLTTITATGSVNASSPCTAPCADWVAFSDSKDDTNSSPFYDYTGNYVYVGDSNGELHKFKNVFHNYAGGTNTSEPSYVSGWPVTVAAGDVLTSPVYDSGGSGLVFVGTGAGQKEASVNSSGTVVLTSELAYAGGAMLTPPVVDSTNEKVYVPVNHGGISGDDHSVEVYQFLAGTSLSSQTSPHYAGFGGAATLDADGFPIYFAFDNSYYSTGSGDLYVCGTQTTSRTSELWRASVSASGFGTPSAGPVVASGTGTYCSPVTEIYNGTTDYIFLSIGGAAPTGSPISCPNPNTGCLMSFDVTSGTQTFSSSAPATHAKDGAPSGTGGIVIDNIVNSPTGASQVYFSILGSETCAGNNGNGSTGNGTGGCAIQASQAALGQ